MAIAKNSKNLKKKSTEKSEKPKLSAFKSAVSLTLDQFLESTTVHGMKHINDARGNKFTKLYWISIIAICFCCAIALMVTFLIRYKSNPTRVNIETNFGAIYELDFPAVTFCNPNFIADSMVSGLIKSLYGHRHYKKKS
jgi:Amiloride-sensitive sodium channel